MITITDIFSYVMEFFHNMYDVAQLLLIIFFTPLKNVGSAIVSYTDALPWLGTLVDNLLEYLGRVGFMGMYNLADFSLVTLMVGFGVLAYIVYQLIVWLLNIVT